MARYKTSYEKATMKLFEEFDEAARNWGWTQDQGIGRQVDASEKQYNAAKANLLKRINELSSARRKLTKLRKEKANES